MELNEASARLRALAKDDKMRPETARLRDIFDDVETALNAGVSQVNVLAELKKLGYTMTLASFKSALQRIRKERNKEGKTAPQVRVNSPATPDVLDRSRRSGDLAPQEVGAVVQVEPEKQEAGEDDNPLIAMGIGTSLQKVASEPKVKLTFNKRNQVG